MQVINEQSEQQEHQQLQQPQQSQQQYTKKQNIKMRTVMWGGELREGHTIRRCRI
ncbi:MAG: hypothetical protein WBP64_14385 [Nitrososphaeraceae archaeon]